MSYHDLEKKRATWRAWYHRNKSEYAVKTRPYKRRRRRETQEWFHSLKATLSCVHCGESDAACLDFHHREDEQKDRCVAQMWGSWGKRRILEEIAKCDVLCANCHRKLHRDLAEARRREEQLVDANSCSE